MKYTPVYLFLCITELVPEIKHRNTKLKTEDSSIIYPFFFCTSMILSQYTHVASKNYLSNCLRHIILFHTFNVL